MKILSQLANEVANTQANVSSARVSAAEGDFTYRHSFTDVIAATNKQKGKAQQVQSSKTAPASNKQDDIQSEDDSIPASHVVKPIATHHIGLDVAAVTVPDSAFGSKNPAMLFQTAGSLSDSVSGEARTPQLTSSVLNTISIPSSKAGIQSSLPGGTTALPNTRYMNTFSGISSTGVARIAQLSDISPVLHAGQAGASEQSVDSSTSPKASGDAINKPTQKDPSPIGLDGLALDTSAGSGHVQVSNPAVEIMPLQTSDPSSSNSVTPIDPSSIATQTSAEAARTANLQPLMNLFGGQPVPNIESGLSAASSTFLAKASQSTTSGQNHSVPSVGRSVQEISTAAPTLDQPGFEYGQATKPSVGSVSSPASDLYASNHSTSITALTSAEASPQTDLRPATNSSASLSTPILDSGLLMASSTLPMKTVQGISNTNVQVSSLSLQVSKGKQSEQVGDSRESDRKTDTRSDIKSSGESDDTFSVDKGTIGTTGAASSHRDPDAGNGSAGVAPIQHNASVTQQAEQVLPNPTQSGLQQAAHTVDSRAATVAPPHTLVANAPQQVQELPAVNSAQLIQSMHHSEMRLGMQSAEFGNISISTSVNREVLSAHISIDHAELGRALSPHLQAIEDKLSSAHGLNARVTVSDGANEYTRGDSGGNPGQRSKEDRYQDSAQPTGHAMSISAPIAVSMSSTTSPAYANASRLDIRI